VEEELITFLLEQRKERKLSLRSLSINSGLSPGTVNNIIHRKYEPTLYSLNRIADYLGVKREFMWQLAGLIDNVGSPSEDASNNPRLVYLFARANKLPKEAREQFICICELLIPLLEREG